MPQVPRTPAEDDTFSTGLMRLDALLRFPLTTFLSLRESADDYAHRAWCAAELAGADTARCLTLRYDKLGQPLEALKSHGVLYPAAMLWDAGKERSIQRLMHMGGIVHMMEEVVGEAHVCPGHSEDATRARIVVMIFLSRLRQRLPHGKPVHVGALAKEVMEEEHIRCTEGDDYAHVMMLFGLSTFAPSTAEARFCDAALQRLVQQNKCVALLTASAASTCAADGSSASADVSETDEEDLFGATISYVFLGK
eukprot:TRINITY_DN13228_c0_g1_i1.p1 TRINITY_DN13228_c0_g1~~TRINITY_DN13228_c0_g1_i1.p1  ORF type:complete len:274 (-),score=50.58 TRINITY_DN13228_c0_g1_i1:85-840(-)